MCVHVCVERMRQKQLLHLHPLFIMKLSTKPPPSSEFVAHNDCHVDRNRKSRGPEPEVTWTGSHVDRKSRGPEVTWTGRRLCDSLMKVYQELF